MPVPSRIAVEQALARLPDNHQHLCHGDFHPLNVLVTGSGQATIIDWNDATYGNPLADVARTSLLLRLATAPQSAPSSFENLRPSLHEAYIEHYFALCPCSEGRAKLQQWLPIIAAARLSENIVEREQANLLQIIDPIAQP